MKFYVYEKTYNGQGSEKAFAVHDQFNRTYWIPRSQIKIEEKSEPINEFDEVVLTVEVADWIIRKNGLPIFKLTEMQLVR